MQYQGVQWKDELMPWQRLSKWKENCWSLKTVGRDIIRVKKQIWMNNLLHKISAKPNFFCHGSRLDKDWVICTYEKPSSSEQTSPVDRVLVQNTHSSAELTVHLTVLRTESGLATFETVSDCKKECVRDNINNSKVISLSGGECL